MMQAEEVLPRDETCPWCSGNVDYYDDAYDGTEGRCRACGRRVVAVEYPEFMAWCRVERLAADERTGRQRTRALWRRRGRR